MDSGENSYRRYLNGDEDAFGEVVELYFDNLTYFINGYVHDVHASEDLAVDALTELVTHPHRFAFRSSLRTWLYSVARNMALNYVSKRSREIPTPLSEADAADVRSLENDVLAGERQRLIARTIAELDEELRTAVHLVYIEGMSYSEAAKVLKKNEKQLGYLLSKAKTLLRGRIGREDVDL
ncbi:MAG: RNA polymerase sigma factor [Clostridia bacterium]|nr:RNA polymerase sigma factor [Clostridia bacterium]